VRELPPAAAAVPEITVVGELAATTLFVSLASLLLCAAPGFGLEAARWGHGLKLARRRRATIMPDWEIDKSLTDEPKERRRELAQIQKQLEQREADTRAAGHSTTSPPQRRKAPRRLETLEMTDSRPSTPPHVPDAALRAEVLAAAAAAAAADMTRPPGVSVC
jgi:hypothetical protein